MKKALVLLVVLHLGLIRQVDVSAMTAQQKSRIVPRFCSSPFVTISQRRDYYVKMQAELLCLPGWQVKERSKFTAGGMTMACHIILVADAENYEQVLPKVDEVLNLVRIHLQSPSIRFPG